MADIELGLIEGEGIGPEVVRSARQVFDEASGIAGREVRWRPLLMGHAAIAEHGHPLPAATLDALAGLPGWLAGPHDSASYPRELRAPAPGGVIRSRFGLFANVRPARAFAGVRAACPDIDVVIVRENTEGFYSDRNMSAGTGEFLATPDVALTVGKITRSATARIAEYACALAAARRGRLTIVHKANALPLSMGLFRDVCYAVAADYPDLRVSDEHVDAMAALLVRNPGDFDVIVAENLFGDILSDLAGELAGSLGIAASLNCSATQAMAQAAHGAAPRLAGHNRANPIALILSAAMLAHWLAAQRSDPAWKQVGDRIENAVRTAVEAGHATGDLGGIETTSGFTEQVLARLHRR